MAASEGISDKDVELVTQGLDFFLERDLFFPNGNGEGNIMELFVFCH